MPFFRSPKPGEMLDSADVDVLRRAFPPGVAPTPWATLPGVSWFCHMCDSNCRERSLATVDLRPRRGRRQLLVWQPHEWWHVYQYEVPGEGDVQEVVSIMRRALRPGSGAVRWNPDLGVLERIEGRVESWKAYRR